MGTGGGRPDVSTGTPDLLLRPWSGADALALRAAIDEDLAHLKPWLGWTLEEPATLERTRQRLLDYADQLRRGAAFRYAIAPAEEPSFVLGGAHLTFRAGPGAHDVGYWVRRSVVRQGIAAAAVSRLAVFAFEEREADGLLIRCDLANERSAAFARALGFQPAGSETVAYPDGTPRPVLRFELSRERYQAECESDLRTRARRVRLVSRLE